MLHQRNVEGLRENAKKKRQEAIARTDEAIQQLIRERRPINFKTVAEAADVSTAWLYKEPEIKTRIEKLRAQGTCKEKSVPAGQKASDASKNAQYQALKQRLQRVEAENRGLREHMEAIHGRYQVLSEENEAKGRENERLRKLLDDANIEIARLMSSAPAIPDSCKKVISIDKRRGEHPIITNEIKQELAELGIKLNSTLIKTLGSASDEVALDAIAAFKEAIASGGIEKPGAWLKQAIEQEWKPNDSPSGKTAIQINTEFRQWFDLAKADGIVRAQQETESGFMVQDSAGQWASWESYVERGWTLEYLKKRAK